VFHGRLALAVAALILVACSVPRAPSSPDQAPDRAGADRVGADRAGPERALTGGVPIDRESGCGMLETNPIYVAQKYLPAPLPFWRKGNELHTRVSVSAAQVAAGTELLMEIPDGHALNVRIIPIVKDGYCIRSNSAIPNTMLYVHIHVTQ
jgi:hypothetical protein